MAEDEDPLEEFVSFLDQFVKNKEFLPPDSTLYIHAFNGSKFDHVFMIPIMYKLFRDMQIIGNTINIKMAYDKKYDVHIQLVDTRLATGAGSLNQFAKQMGIQTKKEHGDLLKIRSE